MQPVSCPIGAYKMTIVPCLSVKLNHKLAENFLSPSTPGEDINFHSLKIGLPLRGSTQQTLDTKSRVIQRGPEATIEVVKGIYRINCWGQNANSWPLFSQDDVGSISNLIGKSPSLESWQIDNTLVSGCCLRSAECL